MFPNFRFFSSFGIKDDNFVFQLLYRWTTTILVIFSSIVTFKLWLGDSFSCTSKNDIPYAVLNFHCYAAGTFIIQESLDKKPGIEVPYRGVDKYSPGQTELYLHYYGWVNLFLLAQAFQFYLPRLLWKAYEQGYLLKLVMGIDKLTADEDKRRISLDILAKYIIQFHGRHFFYGMVFICCEVLNLMMAVCGIVWLNVFFNITEVKFENWDDFSASYFPLMSKCTLYRYGSSGDTQRYDAMCSLPLNNTYEFMYRFLYKWYIFLAAVTALNLVHRVVLLIPSLRVRVLKRKASFADDWHLKFVCRRSSYCDWFLLSRVQKNLRQDNFAELVATISAISKNSEKTDKIEIADTLP